MKIFGYTINACEEIEEYYKEWCIENDESNGLPTGTSYKEGSNIEFYIEAMSWHKVSKALHELVCNRA